MARLAEPGRAEARDSVPAMKLVFSCSLLFVVAAAACAPHLDVPASEVPALGSLEDVMKVQATVADPQFKKIGDEQSYEQKDFDAFADLSTRIQATSTRAKNFSKGPGFDQLADQLHDRAAKLGTAAAAKNGKDASTELAAMKATCKECHSKFR